MILPILVLANVCLKSAFSERAVQPYRRLFLLTRQVRAPGAARRTLCVYLNMHAVYSGSLLTRFSFADIIKLVAASSSSPSAQTFGSAFHTPAGGLHVSALPPAAAHVTGSAMQELPANNFLFITRILLCSGVACIPRSATSR